MDYSNDMQDKPLDLSKKASTDSVKYVQPVIPAIFASSQCGLSNPMEKTGLPTEEEMVLSTYSHEASREMEEDKEEAAEKNEFKQYTIQENFDAMERRVNTRYELPNHQYCVPSLSECCSHKESTQLLERSGKGANEEIFKAKLNFSRHFKNQKKDRPYKFEECDIAFEQKKNFDSRAKTHPGYKPYRCQEFDKAFNEEGNHNKHNNIHNGNEPYKCKDCNKAFNRKHLVAHEIIHTGNKPYECQVCDRKFNNIWNLKCHNDIHTGNKRHICNLCNKAFTQKSHMERHSRIHTADKPFKCRVCDKGFTRKEYLKKHELTYKNKVERRIN